VEGISIPPALSSSVVDVASSLKNTSEFFQHHSRVSSLSERIDSINLMTFLMPTNPAFLDGTYTTEEIDIVLQNHMFLELVYMDEWQNRSGSYIKSMNGNEWLIEADGGSIFLLNAAGGRVQVYGNDVLFKDGVVHFVDSFLNASSRSVPTASPTTQEGDRALLMNASFLAFSQTGGTARSLSTPSNANTLNKAFDAMMNSVVSNQESPQRRVLKKSSRRRLAVSLSPESSKVYGVSDVDCTEYDGVPAGSSCQTVFAHYKLQLQGENEQEVEKTYDAATQKAIEEGKLQQSLDQVDPAFPFKVAAITDEPAPSSDKMEWCVILFIVLGCLFGVCGLCFIGAFLVARPERRKRADEELEAPLMEGSLHEGTSEQSKDEQEDSSAHMPSNTRAAAGDCDDTPDEDNVRTSVVEKVKDNAYEDGNGIARSTEQREHETKEGGESWGSDDGEWEYDDSPQGENHAEDEGDRVHFAKMTKGESAKVKARDDLYKDEEGNYGGESWADEDTDLPHNDQGDQAVQQSNADDGGEVMRSPATDGSSDESEFFDANDSPMSDPNFDSSMKPVTEQQTRESGTAIAPVIGARRAFGNHADSDDDSFDDEDVLGIPQLRSELEEIDRRASETFEAF
jgi:Fasciclin domain